MTPPTMLVTAMVKMLMTMCSAGGSCGGGDKLHELGNGDTHVLYDVTL